jgi:hypothetical protein
MGTKGKWGRMASGKPEITFSLLFVLFMLNLT